MLTLDMVREAQEALRGIARRTPLDRASSPAPPETTPKASPCLHQGWASRR